MLRIIERQAERRKSDGRELLFAIQSDEGPWPWILRERKHYFGEMTTRELHMKMGIVNALRLPAGMEVTQDTIKTPINNWRTILGGLLGLEMDLLPHRSFIYPLPSSVFRFCDVTAHLWGGLGSMGEESSDGDSGTPGAASGAQVQQREAPLCPATPS